MSIFKDTFRDYVRRQLLIRENLISVGNQDDPLIGERADRTKTYPRKGSEILYKLDGEEFRFQLDPGAFYNYTLNKQCVIRMTSLVDYVAPVSSTDGLQIGGLEGNESFQKLSGAALSQNFILQGGVLSDYARRTPGNPDPNAAVPPEIQLKRVDQVRQGFPIKGSPTTNTAYGDISIGSDAGDGYGIVPMPGITSANIRTKSAYGSLREAKVEFECHNRRQLEVLEMLYMRPGYMVLLEWGWCPFIDNNGDVQHNLRLVENESNDQIYTNNISQTDVFKHINTLKESQSGNYDGLLAFVKNFGFKARPDGGYTCYTELISMGEVMESLKIPAVSMIGTLGGPLPPDTQNQVVISGGFRDNNQIYKLDEDKGLWVRQGDVQYDDGLTQAELDSNLLPTRFNRTGYYGNVLTREIYDEAILSGIFPQFNGLQGLITSIDNYIIFGLGSQMGNVGRAAYGDARSDQINKVFEVSQYIEPDRYNGTAPLTPGGSSDLFGLDDEKTKDLNKAELARIEAQLSSVRSLSDDVSPPNQYFDDTEDLFASLLTFQSSDFEEVLINRFAGDRENILNYIIPPSKPGYTNVQFGGMKQSYIRWDALTILINSYLIPFTEKGTPAVKVVTDRIHNTDDGFLKMDPLLFCPITSYELDQPDNLLLDFSCDPNICILPLQFDEDLEEDQSGADPLYIKETIGYKPNLSVIPTLNILENYGANTRNVLYRDEDLMKVPLNEIRLNDTDKNRRIGSIFLNVKMLTRIADNHEDDPDYSVGAFINDIWKEVNKACPNHNFVLTDDKESNTIFIIDLPVDQSEIPTSLHEFTPFSNKTILREFDYTSNVPSKLTSTIAIQAQDPRSIQDIDGVTFAAFNRSIKNRLLSKDTESSFDKAQKDVIDERSKIIKQQKTLLGKIIQYKELFFQSLSESANDQRISGPGNIIGTLKTYQKKRSLS